ncbi:hypothetical protein HPB50_020546 [Hyalomma asiaticum]|uniref:Uncharacterized protein n=1 Tax=Hyalomma asiaticum TaxID=266040 RepID=A0ACB7TND2_HYAAI|nr:hypothetical protein HPB50_020546 [Hyalomma asiaticum]
MSSLSLFGGRVTYRVGVEAGHRTGRAGAAGVVGTSCAEAALPCIAGRGTARTPPAQLVYLYAALSISANPPQSMAPSRASPRLRCRRGPWRPWAGCCVCSVSRQKVEKKEQGAKGYRGPMRRNEERKRTGGQEREERTTVFGEPFSSMLGRAIFSVDGPPS